MGNKDWSHLRNEHQSRFSKGQPKEAPLEKGSPEKLEDTLAKEPEVVEVPAFQEEVKQEEERKDEPAIGVKEESYDPKEGSFATPGRRISSGRSCYTTNRRSKVRNTSTKYNRASLLQLRKSRAPGWEPLDFRS